MSKTFQESRGFLGIRSVKPRSLCRLMHDLASYLAIRHKFSPGADLHNVRSVQRMHEWHAREGMQFVPTLATRFCTDTEKRRSCRARNTRKCHGGTVRGGENESEKGLPIGRRRERRYKWREREREREREKRVRNVGGCSTKARYPRQLV